MTREYINKGIFAHGFFFFGIFAEEAKHSVPALAYRIETEEKVVVYSGDTEASSHVAALAANADLLIHECSFLEPFDVTNTAHSGSLAVCFEMCP